MQIMGGYFLFKNRHSIVYALVPGENISADLESEITVFFSLFFYPLACTSDHTCTSDYESECLIKTLGLIATNVKCSNRIKLDFVIN